MIYLLFAMKVEAEPFLNKLSLKKLSDKPFEIYEDESKNVKIAISGIGKVNIAGATSYLLKDIISPIFNYEDFIFNIGICGSLNDKYKISEAVLCNKIKDYETKKNFYSDILIEHPLKEGTIQSIYTLDQKYEFLEDLVDMEASAFFQVASKFLYTHQIYVLKFVSDYVDKINQLNVKKLPKNFIKSLIETNIEPIFVLLKNIHYLLKSNLPLIQKKDIEIIENFSRCLNLTFTQKEQLKNAYFYAKSRKIDPLKILEKYMKITPKNKYERNIIFENVKNEFYK
ncbi:hypothetical protein [Petrotoga sp. 9PWA.NaAc.5.4]|uniref:5'-methylthioadenosine/S-adenosylhomocysteine nucleosidase family protein n=1 Tax=Petrotoga sp. 9PWA.NaAc.5.4 TaxID=1434328 RepID=UPI000CB964D4|nr:hypothetical protein [Petrotoga sp. 9PWA.NaAc.5.4]PNR97214.1 hypothetical protein X924_00745 [Petrotoga sp. 9PWA.NaAc.5.4]